MEWAFLMPMKGMEASFCKSTKVAAPVQERIISKGIRGSDQLDGFP